MVDKETIQEISQKIKNIPMRIAYEKINEMLQYKDYVLS